MTMQVDTAAVIKVLQDIYADLLEGCLDRLALGYTQALHPDNMDIPGCVISIAPKGRRKEDAWFKSGAWESQTQTALHILTNDDNTKLDEIYISGEALARTPEEIIKLMLHQVVHQITTIPYGGRWGDPGSYHGSGFRYLSETLGMTMQRDTRTGWTNVIRWPLWLTQLIKDIENKIDTTVFDSFRIPAKPTTSQAKMKLWHCTGCTTPVKIRAARIFKAVCTACGSKIVYADKDRHQRADLQSRYVLGPDWILP